MHTLLYLACLSACLAISLARSPNSPRMPRPPLTPRPPAPLEVLAYYFCEATNVTTYNTYLAKLQTTINSKLTKSIPATKTNVTVDNLYDQYIPGNILGFNYWDGCYFTGTSTSTTKIGGIALQMSPLVAAAPPTCVMANNITTFTTTVPFSFVDPSSLTFSITENYKGSFCSNPSFNSNYLTANGYLGGIRAAGTMSLTGYVNSTSVCFTNYTIAAFDITYSSASFTVNIPPMGFSSDVTNKLEGKLNSKLPTASAKIQSKINTAVANALPMCKNPTTTSG